jgi:hypothetical protein
LAGSALPSFRPVREAAAKSTSRGFPDPAELTLKKIGNPEYD